MQQNAGARRRLLVVEVDVVYQTLYEDVLHRVAPDADLEQAANGHEALASIAEHPPDLVLMDLSMSGLDGFSLLSIVKSKAEYRSMPMLVVSTLTGPRIDAIRALPGVIAFRKPMPPDLLAKILPQLLPLPPAPIAAEADAWSPFEARMRKFVGPDRTLQRAIARQFYELAPDRIARLQRLLDRPARRDLRDWCHAMRGTAAMIGDPSLDSRIDEFSDAVASGGLADLHGAAQPLIEALRRVAVALHRGLEQP